jgi:hypothetical protein
MTFDTADRINNIIAQISSDDETDSDAEEQQQQQLANVRCASASARAPGGTRSPPPPAASEPAHPSEQDVIDANFLFETILHKGLWDLRNIFERGLVTKDTATATGHNALIMASRVGNIEVMDLLINEWGFDPLYEDADGASALHWAIINGHMKAAVWLVEDAGVSPTLTDRNLNDCCHYAARCGRLALLRYFVEEVGLCIYRKNVKGQCLKVWADRSGFPQIRKYVDQQRGVRGQRSETVNSAARSVFSILQQHGSGSFSVELSTIGLGASSAAA